MKQNKAFKNRDGNSHSLQWIGMKVAETAGRANTSPVAFAFDFTLTLPARLAACSVLPIALASQHETRRATGKHRQDHRSVTLKGDGGANSRRAA